MKRKFIIKTWKSLDPGRNSLRFVHKDPKNTPPKIIGQEINIKITDTVVEGERFSPAENVLAFQCLPFWPLVSSVPTKHCARIITCNHHSTTTQNPFKLPRSFSSTVALFQLKKHNKPNRTLHDADPTPSWCFVRSTKLSATKSKRGKF